MEKISITVSNQVEVYVEFPYYTKVSDYTYCFFKAQNQGISVHNYTTCFKIMTAPFPDNWYIAEQITKEEFDKVFNEVQDKINQLI